MEQYVKYLRKSRFDRDYAELSVEDTLKRHEAILDKVAEDRGYYIAKTYYEVVSGESIAVLSEAETAPHPRENTLTVSLLTDTRELSYQTKRATLLNLTRTKLRTSKQSLRCF